MMRGQAPQIFFPRTATASAWPRYAAEEPAAKKESTDQYVCTLPTTGRHTMIEDSVRENEKLNCVVLIIMT